MPQLVTLPNGTKGFDCNFVVSVNLARSMHALGYRFVARYVRRGAAHPYDVTRSELAALHVAGLAVMLVQHVESADAWTPSEAKGVGNGAVAANEALLLRVPPLTPIACDLEGVATDVDASVVDAYARAWYRTVASAGYKPVLYVGWHAGLDAHALYRLPFTSYWAAYNLNRDQYPERVGVQLQQKAAGAHDVPSIVHVRRHTMTGTRALDRTSIDVDVVQHDALGRLPTAYAPDEWAPLHLAER